MTERVNHRAAFKVAQLSCLTPDLQVLSCMKNSWQPCMTLQ